MSTAAPLPGNHTFVVRLWRETGGKPPQWRGWIEHIQTGQRRAFTKLTEMLEFMDDFVTLGDRENG